MQFNIADIIEGTVDAVPDRLALVAGDRRLTYADLDGRANRLAHHLAAHGVGPGDHVGIYAYNCAEWIETFLACFKLRAVPINVNYRYVEDELRYLFANADLVALVHQRQFSPRVESLQPEFRDLRHYVVIDDGSEAPAASGVPYEEALTASSPERTFGARSGDDIYMLYTGGTTGMPKGVIWRHEDVIFVLGGGFDVMTGAKRERPESYAEQAVAGGMVSLPLPPLMHGACQWGTLNGLFVGNTVVLYTAQSFDADEVWRLVAREKVNVVSLTGDAMGRPLAEALAAADGGHDLSSLVSVSSTAAVFSPAVKQVFLERLPTHTVVTEAIGSSETGFNGLTLVTDPHAGSGGGPTVSPGPETIVIDDDGRPLPPGSGAVGRLARSGHTPLGYYKDAEKSAATFIDVEGVRYAVPGDYARLEPDGSITLLGRGSVCINSGGEKIFPEEVEKAVKAHPDVFDAVVVGVPDERWGQRVAAVVEARPGRTPTLQSLDAFCRATIAGYKVPRELHIVEQVMRSPAGKPDYPWALAVALKART